MRRLYSVHFLDVWGNAGEGYGVHEVYPSQGTISLEDNDNIADRLMAEGFVTEIPDRTLLEIDTMSYEYSICLRYDGKPELQLNAIREDEAQSCGWICRH